MNSALAQRAPVSGVVRSSAVAPVLYNPVNAKLLAGLHRLRARLIDCSGEFVLVERQMFVPTQYDGHDIVEIERPLGTQYSLGIIDVGEPLALDLRAKAVHIRTRMYASLVDADGTTEEAAAISRDISFRFPETLFGFLTGLPELHDVRLSDDDLRHRRSRCTIAVGDAEVEAWARPAPIKGAVLHTLEDALFDGLARR